MVAVAGFYRVDELARFARVRRSAIVFAGVALVGVLVLGVLQGLIVAAGLSLVYVVKRLSRPSVGVLARDPATGDWGRADRHPGWLAPDDVLAVASAGPLFYPNAFAVKERVLALADAADPPPSVVVLDLLQSTELDLQTADTLGELADALEGRSMRLRLASVRAPAMEVVRRAGLLDRLEVAPTLDAATGNEKGPAP